MAEKDWLLGDTPNPLGDRVGEIRKKLQGKNPETLASHTGANYLSKGNNGEFQLAFWSRDVVITFPEFVGHFADTGEELNPFDMTMLAYYFDVSDSVPLAGEWIAFKQIPGGLFYAQAFQGYSGDELLKVFGDDVDNTAHGVISIKYSAAAVHNFYLGDAVQWNSSEIGTLQVNIVETTTVE